MASARRITSSSLPLSMHGRYLSGHVCLQCQRRAFLSATRPQNVPPTSTGHIFPSQRRHATNRPENDDFEGSFADKLRKKIWGTDNPPGQRNPYVRETPEELEERLAEEEERLLEEESKAREAEDFARLAGRKGSLDHTGDDIPEETLYEERLDDPDGRVSDYASSEPTEAHEYKPATTWRGLRHVPAWKVLQQAPQFAGFISPHKLDHPEAIESVVQRALVEVWTLKQAGLPLTIPNGVGNASDAFVSRLGNQTSFKSTASGERILEYNDPGLQEEVILSLGHGPNQNSQITLSPEDVLELDESLLVGSGPRQELGTNEITGSSSEAEQMIAGQPVDGTPILGQSTTESPSDGFFDPADKSWRGVSITQPEIKFAVLKRVMQLTGTRIPDPEISRLRTAEDLRALLVKPPKPTKLADKLIEKENLINSPHVELFDTRWTEKDREQEIGRWKLITAELTKRGLPHDSRDIRLSRKARKDTL